MLPICQSVLQGKIFSIGHWVLTFQPNCFVPVMLIDTIDFWHFIPLSLTLTFAESHKVSTKQLTFWLLFFPHTFQLTEMKLDMVIEQFKLRLLLSKRFLYSREMSAVLLTT